MYNTEGSGELPYIKRIIHLMGATIAISLADSEDPSLLDAVEERLNTYNMRFSANDARSELMQVNLQAGLAPVTVHPELFELIQLGRTHSLAPGSPWSKPGGLALKMPASQAQRKFKRPWLSRTQAISSWMRTSWQSSWPCPA